MGILKTVAIVTSVVVALFAALLASKPHLVFKIPKIGFIIHAIRGGNIPPFIDREIFKYDDQWAKKGDVFLAVGGKCGTTWMMYTMNLIRSHGNPPAFRDLYEEIPWAEFVYYPGQTLAERIEVLKNISNRYPFAIYKTHDGPPLYKFRKDIKYIVGVRNLVDVAASLKTFFHNHGKEFAKMWGGFPPSAGATLWSDEEFEKFFLKDDGSGKGGFIKYGFDVYKAFWPYRHEPNVLFVHYSDRLKDDRTQIKKMADFVGVKLTEEELDKVTKASSFSEMKKQESKVNLLHLFDQFKAKGLIPEDVFILTAEDGPKFLSKGPGRKGEQEVRESMIEGVGEAIRSVFGSEIAQWIKTGGPLPDVELPKTD